MTASLISAGLRWVAATTVLALAPPAMNAQAPSPGKLATTRVSGLPGAPVRTRPASFLAGLIENRGQWPADCHFAGTAAGLWFRVGDDEILLRPAGADSRVTLRIPLPADTGDSEPWLGVEPLPGVRHFFLDADPERAVTDVPAFAAVQRSRSRTSLAMRDDHLLLEFTLAGTSVSFECVPDIGEAPPRTIADGGTARLVLPNGTMSLSLEFAQVMGRPGSSRQVSARFETRTDGRIDLLAPDQPESQSVAATVAIEWSTFLGGSDGETVAAVRLSESGTTTVGGGTLSADFPVTPGAFDPTYDPFSGVSLYDVYVARLEPDGDALCFASYLGGSNGDLLTFLDVAADGTTTLGGYTASTSFPTTPGAFSQQLKLSDAFVTRLAPDGASLLWSTFLGGSASEFTVIGGGVVLPDGSVVIGGETYSDDFPVTTGPAKNGLTDAFVTRLAADGSGIVFSRRLGGSCAGCAGESVGQVAWYPGRIVVGGSTLSADFPFTPGAWSEILVGPFITQLDDTTGEILASTSLGGSNADPLRGLAVDAFGNVYAAGHTQSTDFPATPDAFQPGIAPSLGAPDAYVTCLDPDLTTILHSTFYGGNLQEFLDDIEVSPSGLVTITGLTNSAALPVTPGAIDTALNGVQGGPHDAFIARFDRELTALHYGSYLGGTGKEWLTSGRVSLDVGSDGRVAVALGTASPDFPVTPGSFDTHLDGVTDAAVLLMDLLPAGVARVGASTPGSFGLLPMGVTAMPQVGSETFAVHCGNVPPDSSRGLLLLALGAADAPLQAGGAGLWLDPATLFAIVPVTSDAYGYVEVALRVPTDPALAGVQAAGQFAWRDPGGAPGLWSASNALLMTLQP